LIAVFALANVGFHLGQRLDLLAGYGERLALAAVALLIALIGGRITPSFTRNWMAQRALAPQPAPFDVYDKTALVAAAIALSLWIAAPTAKATGAMLGLAGAFHIVRLVRWRGLATLREPIVTILHVGYFWLALAFLLLGASILLPDLVDRTSALHALTAGAIGTMTLAVMTRASRGHTGRPITAGPATIAIYALVTAGAVTRVAASSLPVDYVLAVATGGLLWSAAFLLFAFTYVPVLLRSPHTAGP
jgi:uncharacterized protein involved in response to NO